MRLILKSAILSLTLFIFSTILNSCVEEPTIDLPPKLSSLIRVVNVSNDMNNIKVTIDDQVPVQALNSIAKGAGTEFFDIFAGKKKFKVFDEGGTLIYTKDVDLISYELMTIVFAGDYDQDELLNSFSSFELSEGETYVSHTPPQGTSGIYFVHASAPVDTFTSRKYIIAATFIPTGATSKDTIYNADPNFLEYSQELGVGAVPGSYTFALQSQQPASTTNFTAEIEANYRYYMFMYGNPNNVQVFQDKVVPPAIRSRD